MGGELPRDEQGRRLCDRCHGPIDQPKIGRQRIYCGRNCRELAYRERSTQRRIDEAVQAATVPSVDETEGAG